MTETLDFIERRVSEIREALETEKERKMGKHCDLTNPVPFRLELIAAVCREAAESYRQGNKDEVEKSLYYVEERVSEVWKLLRGEGDV